MIEVVDFVRRTLLVVVPTAVVFSVVTLIAGHSDLSLGFFLGVSAGLLDATMMTVFTLKAVNHFKSFITRYVLVGVIFTLAVLVGMASFFACAVGFFFAMIVFVMDQSRTGDRG